ncbi:MAG: hypothetical protein U1F66_13405 [bacterium]
MAPPNAVVKAANGSVPQTPKAENSDVVKGPSADVLIDSSMHFGGMPASGHSGGFVWGGELGAHGTDIPVGGSFFLYRKLDNAPGESKYSPHIGNGVTYFGIKPAVSFYPGYNKDSASGVFGSFRLGIPLGMKVQDSVNGPNFVMGLSLDSSVANFLKINPENSVGVSLGGLSLSVLASPFGTTKSVAGFISVSLNPFGFFGSLI